MADGKGKVLMVFDTIQNFLENVANGQPQYSKFVTVVLFMYMMYSPMSTLRVSAHHY